jgi:hypothetical protein
MQGVYPVRNTPRHLLGRCLHLCKAPGGSLIDRANNLLHVRSNLLPLLTAEDQDCNLPTGKALLLPHVLVSGDQHLECGFFGDPEQVSIPKPVPTLLRSCADNVTLKVWPKWHWCRLIKKN